VDLNEINIFIKVVEIGSFIGAARALDIPKSTVSAKVSSLEERLGITLIKRTTRKLHITDIGQEYYEQCRSALTQISEAEKQVTLDQSIPSGLLRLSAPIELGNALLPSVILEFKKKFPQVSLEVILTDRNVDFIAERIDLGIRVGTLKDSSLIAKKLGNIYFAPFVGPKYLKNHPTPKTPKDIEQHHTIVFSPIGEKWDFISQSNSQTIKVDCSTEINDLNLIKSLTTSGLGIALLPTFHCLNEAKSGKLVRILKKWRSQERPVHIIYPSQKFISPKIRSFIDLATDTLKASLETAEL